MLGWGINIWRQIDPSDTPAHKRRGFIGDWEAGPGGRDWPNALAADGRAVSLGGNGYPLRYTVTAGVLASALRSGPPPNEGSPVVGEDYVLPGG